MPLRLCGNDSMNLAMKTILILLSFTVLLVVIYYLLKKQKPLITPDATLIKDTLQKHVSFYQGLSEEEKQIFENRVQRFLQRTRITGVKVDVHPDDKIFIAAAAIIPIFAFKDWEYKNINEVLLYPGSFTRDFLIEGAGRDTLVWLAMAPCSVS